LKTLVIGWQEVSKILSMAECIPIIREALKSLALGGVVLPLRQGLVQPDKKGILGMIPAYLHNPRVLGLKAISVFPGNRDTPFEAHQSVVLLFGTERGRMLGIVDAGAITTVRTAAASAVAIELLGGL
jgi:ornithine cyclodeaminase